MLRHFQELDSLLRGERTRPQRLAEAGLDAHIGGLVFVITVLCVVYGACMGSFSLLKELGAGIEPSDRYWQWFASAVKTPALFFLTLVITLPSLYVFNALVGSQLSVTRLVKLLTASLAVNAAVLASFGPIAAFFSLSTNNYPFVKLLNVLLFAVAGALGLMFLLQTLHRISSVALSGSSGAPERPASVVGPGDSLAMEGASAELVAAPTTQAEAPKELMVGAAEAHPALPAEEIPRASTEGAQASLTIARGRGRPSPDAASPLDMPSGEALARQTRTVFRCWVALFAVVGAQMGWVLRPFIGDPNLPFAWFRSRTSNFFADVLNALAALVSGN